MKAVNLAAALAVLSVLGSGATTPAAAQFRTIKPAPKTWVTGWVGGYMDPGRVTDAASGNWHFGSAFAGGLGIHRQVGSGLALGIDASFAPASYERRGADNTLLAEGNARLVTAMISGRLRTGGHDSFGMYLTGGAGAFVYGIPELDRWDPDLALHTGAGLEYRPARDKALFVEWGRYWTFHQKEGIRDNTTKHSQIRIGGRVGL